MYSSAEGATFLMARRDKLRPHLIAVLTGDLVRSSNLSAAEVARARAALDRANQQISSWDYHLLAGKVDFFRGDSWQIALGDIRYFLRAAVLVRGHLRSEGIDFDTRISIGIGGADEINSDRTSLSLGEAFTISGRSLDGMTGAGGIIAEVPAWAEAGWGWLKPITVLCSALVDQWTERQADLVVRMLSRPAGIQQIELASELAIAKQTLSKALAAADFAALSAAIDYVETSHWPRQLTFRHIQVMKRSAETGLFGKVSQKRLTS